MEKNVGGYDRIARLVVGPVLLVVGVAVLGGLLSVASGTTAVAIGVVAALVGAILLVTGVTQTCPLNSVLGIDTFRPAK
ncbi:YgaP family membrane protein [Haloglomus litoreum]|uniref:YgaP family membrane protein n=1 Tax=Haloglomus litoreum TaxID=3034026 RepID=UPI003B210CFE